MSDSLVKCMIIIVDRGKSEAIIKSLRGKNVLCSFVMPGHGTATAQWQDLIGLGDIKKDVIITILDKNLIEEVFEGLRKGLGIRGLGKGIAFTIAINSIGGRRLLNYCLGRVEE